jgi:hypothetical protein
VSHERVAVLAVVLCAVKDESNDQDLINRLVADLGAEPWRVHGCGSRDREDQILNP